MRINVVEDVCLEKKGIPVIPRRPFHAESAKKGSVGENRLEDGAGYAVPGEGEVDKAQRRDQRCERTLELGSEREVLKPWPTRLQRFKLASSEKRYFVLLTLQELQRYDGEGQGTLSPVRGEDKSHNHSDCLKNGRHLVGRWFSFDVNLPDHLRARLMHVNHSRFRRRPTEYPDFGDHQMLRRRGPVSSDKGSAPRHRQSPELLIGASEFQDAVE